VACCRRIVASSPYTPLRQGLRPRSKLAAQLTVSSVATRSNFRDGSSQRRAIKRNRISVAHGDAVKTGGTDFSSREGTSIAHRVSKSSLLPMSAQSAREMSLAHHLALAACRGDSANRHQINELVRSVYMAYFLQRMGFGDIPFECYEHAEAAFESALAVAAKCGKWIINEQDAPVIERLLALHDQQLSEAPMHRVVEAEQQLRQFLAGTDASPLVRPKSV
jgi:hypothetical protein